MKDSGIEWIGEIPKEWKIGKVKNCFVKKNKKAKQENPIVLSLARSGVKIRNISTGEGQIAESYFNYNLVEEGDLLINPMDLYTGANCSISKVCGVISPAYINLKSINRNDSRYYDYYFKTQYWNMAFFAHGKGVSFDNRWILNVETLFNYFIPIPPVEEQEKIADYLDKKVLDIDLIIENTKIIIEDYKKYKESIITEAVTKGLNSNIEMENSGIEWIEQIPKGWKVKKIKNVLNIRNEKYIESFGKVKYYGLENIESKSSKYIETENIYDLAHSLICKKNDLIFGKLRPYLAKVYLIPEEISRCSNEFSIFYAKEDVKIEFIKFLFLSNYFIEKVNSSTYGAKMPRASIKFIENIKVFIPSLEEQQQIVEYLDKKITEIDTIILKKGNLIKELEEYKKSLIYEYVTGKKRVK